MQRSENFWTSVAHKCWSQDLKNDFFFQKIVLTSGKKVRKTAR